jgi:hypothetical protein
LAAIQDLLAIAVLSEHVRGDREALKILAVQPSLAPSGRQISERDRPSAFRERTAGPLLTIGHGHQPTIKRDGASTGENGLVAALCLRRSCPAEHVRLGVQPGGTEVEAAGLLDPHAGSSQRGKSVTSAVAAASETGP